MARRAEALNAAANTSVSGFAELAVAFEVYRTVQFAT
jgi:hypothetical protein